MKTHFGIVWSWFEQPKVMLFMTFLKGKFAIFDIFKHKKHVTLKIYHLRNKEC